MNKLTQLRLTAFLLCRSFYSLNAQKWFCAAQIGTTAYLGDVSENMAWQPNLKRTSSNNSFLFHYKHTPIMREIRYFLGCMALFIACLPMQTAFGFNFTQSYIAQYKDLAQQEQRLTGIPASIKLAMALLESGSGQSHLAVYANNHFGIKWWNVSTDGADFIEKFDDAKDNHGRRIASRFIKFNSVEDSYRKHSEVLQRPRYQELFTYHISDYHSWAYGLETCGYATIKGYGSQLIALIDRYNLSQYTLSEEPKPDVISFEKSPKITAKAPPQYLGHPQPVNAVFTPKQPVSMPVKPSIESQFINSRGEKVHYILSEM
jgi:Mannosyl-glycoprotein endo-beta-N-acetylglucosaminidase